MKHKIKIWNSYRFPEIKTQNKEFSERFFSYSLIGYNKKFLFLTIVIFLVFK